MEFRLVLIIAVGALSSNVHGQCNGKADIVIAVPGAGPGSWEVPHTEFESFEPNLIDLLDNVNIAPDQVNVGLILYGNETVISASPQPYKTRAQVNTRVTLMGQRNMHRDQLVSELNVANAIDGIHAMLLNPPKEYGPQILRPNAKKIGIIFLYGTAPTEEISRITYAAERAKRRGIVLYAIGANGTAPAYLRAVGTDICRLMMMTNFEEGLPHAVPDLAKGLCAELDPTVTVTPGNCFPSSRHYGKAAQIPVICETENNMMQADPNNCAYFYRCAFFNAKPERSSCSATTIFDPLSGVCNFVTGVACYNDVSCPDNIQMLHPHPLSCNKFINCFNDRIPYVQQCQDGTFFDFPHQSCNDTSLVTCNKRF